MSDSSNLKEKIDEFKGKSKEFFKGLKGKIKGIDLENLNKENFIKGLLSITTAAFIMMAVNVKTKAYIVNLNGEVLGTVRDETEVDLVLEELKDELKSTYEMDIVLSKEIELEETNTIGDKITDTDEIKNKIKDKMSFLVEGYTLEIDGKEIAALKTEEEVNKVLDNIKKPFEEEVKKIAEESEKINKELEEKEDSKADSEKEEGLEKDKKEKYKIEMLEDVKIKKTELPIYKIGNGEKLEELLLSGGEDIKTHIVEVGESLWTIAKIYDVTMDELIEANPDRDPDELQIGDEINLVITKPLLTVATTIEAEYDREIDYEIDIEEDSSKYTNEKETKREGKKGRAIEVVEEVRHNGKIISEKVLEEKVIEEPVKKLVVQGTKEVPKTVATGSFIMPTRGRISSRYGRRNGRMHRGLDISASAGTPITAADGGRVVSAGWSGSYGNLVVIDHGNGYMTKYAHCSKIHVSPGTRVYKGQHIANVGNTGRSTGPHLHLEVLKNGRNVNPSSFVGK